MNIEKRDDAVIITDAELEHFGMLVGSEQSCIIDIGNFSEDPLDFYYDCDMDFLKAPMGIAQKFYDKLVEYHKTQIGNPAIYLNDECSVAFGLYELPDGRGIVVAVDQDGGVWGSGLFSGGDESFLEEMGISSQSVIDNKIETLYAAHATKERCIERAKDCGIDFFTEDVLEVLFGKE
jgi:hypothetical protein